MKKYTVPHSECAMHMRIAGKAIVAVRKEYARKAFVDVWVEGQNPYQNNAYSGLISELVPIELRDSLPELGHILILKVEEL